jgi:hypothetical protein
MQTMIVLIHVIIAITSLALATFVAFSPSLRRLVAHYAMVVATLGTGTVLLFEFPAKLPTSCAAGLVYLAIAGALTVVAHLRLRARSSL